MGRISWVKRVALELTPSLSICLFGKPCGCCRSYTNRPRPCPLPHSHKKRNRSFQPYSPNSSQRVWPQASRCPAACSRAWTGVCVRAASPCGSSQIERLSCCASTVSIDPSQRAALPTDCHQRCSVRTCGVPSARSQFSPGQTCFRPFHDDLAHHLQHIPAMAQQKVRECRYRMSAGFAQPAPDRDPVGSLPIQWLSPVHPMSHQTPGCLAQRTLTNLYNLPAAMLPGSH